MRFLEPNRHAKKVEFHKIHGGFAVGGYQQYSFVSGVLIPVDDKTITKHKLLTKYVDMDGKSVLDLGSNAGYFLCYANVRKAKAVDGVDIDSEYNAVAQKALDHAGHTAVIHSVNVEDYLVPADVVLCFAMVHWLYSCTSLFGSLDKVIEHIASLTKETAVVEFIHPNDPAMKFFKHNEYNPEVQEEPYDHDHFKKAMSKYFKAPLAIEKINGTREAWVTRPK